MAHYEHVSRGDREDDHYRLIALTLTLIGGKTTTIVSLLAGLLHRNGSHAERRILVTAPSNKVIRPYSNGRHSTTISLLPP